jgi:hypothetical protein
MKVRTLDHFIDFFEIPKISEMKVSRNGSRYSDYVTGKKSDIVR